jgi:hypothetical protein
MQPGTQNETPMRRPFCQTSRQDFLTPPWLRMKRFGIVAVPCTSMQAPPALRSTMLQAVVGVFTSTKIVPALPDAVGRTRWNRLCSDLSIDRYRNNRSYPCSRLS